MTLRTETHLWNYIHPRLVRGRRWQRVEPKGMNPGFADAFGFYGCQTQWIELKVGKPGIRHLRPSQIDFCRDADMMGIPVWCCFAHLGAVKWFRGLDLEMAVVPEFYQPSATVQTPRRHRAPA